MGRVKRIGEQVGDYPSLLEAVPRSPLLAATSITLGEYRLLLLYQNPSKIARERWKGMQCGGMSSGKGTLKFTYDEDEEMSG